MREAFSKKFSVDVKSPQKETELPRTTGGSTQFSLSEGQLGKMYLKIKVCAIDALFRKKYMHDNPGSIY